MKVRFQADADLNHIIVLAVVRREPRIDFQTAVLAGLTALGDSEVLVLAAEQGRVLVSHDQTTMPTHFARFVDTRTSAGVLIVPQHIPPVVVAEELIIIWHATEAEEWANRICYLPI